jgi:hypothetical protein
MSQLTAEDRLAIHELMAVYSRCIDFGRWEELPELFTEDCTLDFGAVMGEHHGKEGVRGFADMLAKTGLTMRHYVTNCIVGGDGERAEATTYVLAFTGQPGSQSPTTGRYEDRLRKVGGRWLLETRRAVIEVASPRGG